MGNNVYFKKKLYLCHDIAETINLTNSTKIW